IESEVLQNQVATLQNPFACFRPGYRETPSGMRKPATVVSLKLQFHDQRDIAVIAFLHYPQFPGDILVLETIHILKLNVSPRRSVARRVAKTRLYCKPEDCPRHT